jgi:uncharacterized protein YndB with AHSA1/START domain
MDPEKWKRLVQRIDVSAPMESVYAAWATAEGVTGWSSMEAVLIDREGNERAPGSSAAIGDRFRFAWHTGHTEEGEFLEANGIDHLHYTMGKDIEVDVKLEKMEDGSVMVTMEQTQDRTDDENLLILLGFNQGWAFYLANLKSVLEGGLDLRNYTHDIEHRLNY